MICSPSTASRPFWVPGFYLGRSDYSNCSTVVGGIGRSTLIDGIADVCDEKKKCYVFQVEKFFRLNRYCTESIK